MEFGRMGASWMSVRKVTDKQQRARQSERREDVPLVDANGSVSIDIMNIMEQGIIVWSADGLCEMKNARIFRVLELTGGDLDTGTRRDVFIDLLRSRGSLGADQFNYFECQVAAHQPYTFDLTMPSGRMVLTNGRPTRGGGYVVTFTDVTQNRRAAQELDVAKREADAAREAAETVLMQERARQHEARLLAGLDEWLQACKSLDELYMIVTAFMKRHLPRSYGELYIYSNSRDVLDGVCGWNIDTVPGHITPDSCWSLRRGRPFEYGSDDICFVCDHVAAGDASDSAHYLCAPIVAHGDTVGMLHFCFDYLDREALTVEDPCTFAIRCSEHISMAIANVKLRDELRDQSIRDPLTGLFNRRFFMETIRQQIADAKRHERSFGIVSFDADRFKTFNDSHGHDAGDAVLRTISQTLIDRLGQGEVACRVGGEEFAIVVPAADQTATLQIAESVRQAVEATQIRYLDKMLPSISISAGVAVFPAHGTEAAHLLRKADEALYEAKDGGRNRVCVAT